MSAGRRVQSRNNMGRHTLTSSPFRDYVLQYRYDVNDRRQAESQAHTELQKLYERRGEWFKCTPEQARVVVSSTAEEYK
jgi:hypothetical protein